MTAREYLERLPENTHATFIISHAVKDPHSPFYDSQYSTTPIYMAREWLSFTSTDGYIVIKADHAPIDVTGAWTNGYKAGYLKCAMLTTEADLIRRYGERQGRDMIEYYARTVK